MFKGTDRLKVGGLHKIKGAGQAILSPLFFFLFPLPNTPFSHFPFIPCYRERAINPKTPKIHFQITKLSLIRNGQISITRLTTSIVSFS
jgi:hypothetical protein